MYLLLDSYFGRFLISINNNNENVNIVLCMQVLHSDLVKTLGVNWTVILNGILIFWFLFGNTSNCGNSRGQGTFNCG